MASRLRRRNLSFEVLSTVEDESDHTIHTNNFYRSISDPLQSFDSPISPKRTRKKRRNRGSKNKKSLLDCSISEDTATEFDSKSFNNNTSSSVTQIVVHDVCVSESNGDVGRVISSEFFNSKGGELRQRNVNGGGDEEKVVCEDVKGEELRQRNVNGGEEEEKKVVVEDVKAADNNVREVNGNVVRKLESEVWLDWKKLMAEDPNCESFLDKALHFYFSDEFGTVLM